MSVEVKRLPEEKLGKFLEAFDVVDMLVVVSCSLGYQCVAS